MYLKYPIDIMNKWSLLIILTLAILVKIIIDNKQSKHVQFNTDIESAITRAKTQSCKKELEEFAYRISLESTEPLQILKRTCGLDLGKQRIQSLGCISNSTHGLLKIDDNPTNYSVCLEHCFSYGHSYGGFNLPSKNCFCGDDKLVHVDHHQQLTKCNGHDELLWYQVNVGIYKLDHMNKEKRIDNQEKFDDNRTIRIAFLLILNGRSTSHIKRLIQNIYSKNHFYYIHVDSRNDYLHNNLLDLENKFDNIFIAKSRFNTIWGGPSLLRMTIDAMSNLSHYDWDYLINLSESDFPIKPLVDLESYLLVNNRMIFLKSHNITGYKFIRKQGLDRNFYQCEDRVWRVGKRQLPRGIIFSGGSDWYALPRDFCNYILNNLSNSHDLVKPLVQLYNYTLLPAESFFHTLALNSEFCDRFADNNLRITNWQRKQGCKCQHKNVVDWCGCSPLVYRWSDWGKLKQTNASDELFFSRKFNPTISSSVIEAVERHLIHREFVTNDESTNYSVSFSQNIYSSEFNVPNRQLSYKYLEQFGLFSLKQQDDITLAENFKLISINSIFNDDRFKGLIYSFCDNNLICVQLLIEENIDAHVDNPKSICVQSNERQLKVIEVSHGFDTGEKMFRNYLPLNSNSDIVVYHEWIINPAKNKNDTSPTDRLLFSWFNPHGQLELMQNVKLKTSSKPTKLSLAHRLNVKEPLISGLWTLTISHHNTNCLSYKFLVFDDRTFVDSTITQYQFQRFYSVSLYCSSNNTITQTFSTNDRIEEKTQYLGVKTSCKIF